MANSLEPYVNHTVSIITADGRNILGTLKGFDQSINLILEDCHERVYHLDKGVEQAELGLYIVRGDNIVCVGELNEEKDKKVDFSHIKAAPINPVVH